MSHVRYELGFYIPEYEKLFELELRHVLVSKRVSRLGRSLTRNYPSKRPQCRRYILYCITTIQYNQRLQNTK
jgi:hypothetical protein